MGISPRPRTGLSPHEARRRFRTGLAAPSTSGWCSGFSQANLLSVPAAAAGAVERFIRANPRSCPLLETVPPGGVESRLAPGSDLRTDVPAYRIWAYGHPVLETRDAARYWPPDMVTFLTGCSFSFEAALEAAAIRLRHVETGRNIAMYRTDLTCPTPDGTDVPLVVSMRPIPNDRLAEVVAICSGMSEAHGAPVWWGDPARLGIDDLHRPDWGDAVEIDLVSETPVFWACGVTLHEYLAALRPPLAVTHAPGRMLITDVPARTAQPTN